MDIKSLLGGAVAGGGSATLLVGLIMSNMATGTKALENQMVSMTRELKAENKLSAEQIKNVASRVDRFEEVGNKTTDRIEAKLDKMIDSINVATKDLWSKADHQTFESQLTLEKETFKRNINLRLDRFDERLLNQSKQLNTLKTKQRGT